MLACGVRFVIARRDASGIADALPRVHVDDVPVLDDAWDFARRDVVPGGTRRNLAAVEPFMNWSERLAEVQRLVLADAQTSGGLLVAVDPSAAGALATQVHGTVIGAFTDGAGRIDAV